MKRHIIIESGDHMVIYDRILNIVYEQKRQTEKSIRDKSMKMM